MCWGKDVSDLICAGEDVQKKYEDAIKPPPPPPPPPMPAATSRLG